MVFLQEAEDDLDRLDKGVCKIVLNALDRVRLNPLPKEEGGYGKRLGHITKYRLVRISKNQNSQRGCPSRLQT